MDCSPTISDGSPNTDSFPNGIAAITALAGKRAAGEPLSPTELRDIATVIRSFLASANNKGKPGKDVLFEAVRSLVTGPRKLSRSWDKTQLSLVLLRWTQDALGLPEANMQQHLSIKVMSNKDKSKQLKHKVSLYDEDTEVTETFQIDSPQPIVPPQGVSTPSVASASASATASPATTTSNSVATPLADTSFLRDIEGLGEEFELLAAIPSVYTPRVLTPAASGKSPSPAEKSNAGPEAKPPNPEGWWSTIHAYSSVIESRYGQS